MRITGTRISGKILLVACLYVPLFLGLAVPFFLAGAAAGAFTVYSKDLPQINKDFDYLPKTVSTFYADDGTVIGTFYEEKRFVVDLTQMPLKTVKAFIAAEDVRFYEHSGVDYRGMFHTVGPVGADGKAPRR